MHDTKTGQMNALDASKMDAADEKRKAGKEEEAKALEQEAKDEAQPDRSRQGGEIRQGDVVNVSGEEGGVIRCKIHSIGTHFITVRPLPGNKLK